MNIFVSPIRLTEWSFRHIQYYSVRVEGETLSLFHDFMDRMDAHTDLNVRDEFERVLYWLEYLGDEEPRSLQDGFFRHEGRGSDAKALPPAKQKARETRKKANKADAQWMESGQLRLYCHAANDNVVFLFNGDMKTEGVREARECDQVRAHFDMANKITSAINEAFKEKDIKWNQDHSDILFDQQLTIEL